jgi:adenosylhomocysteine nucleosidase
MLRPVAFEGEAVTAIVAAMDEEIAPLRARLVGARTLRANGLALIVGRLGTLAVVLAVTGDGARNARRGLITLLVTLPVARLIVIGVAGGLTSELRVPDLVVGDSVVDERDGRVHRSDAALTEILLRSVDARRGVVVTATRIADTVEEKRRIAALAAAALRAGAPPSPAAVDLESAVFLAAAARARVPVVVLRAISDTASEPLPAVLNRSRDEGGGVRRGHVILGLLAAPSALPRLLALRGRVAVCARALALAVERAAAALASAEVSLAPTRAAPLTHDEPRREA